MKSSAKAPIRITQAVILAGGAGTRLQPFTLKSPKPMIPLNGKPFLAYLIEMLKDNGIKEVIILTGYLGEKIEKYFGSSYSGVRIKYSHTPFKNEQGEELKTGIRLKNAEKILNDHFLLMYCDNYWPLQLSKLIKTFQASKTEALVTVFSNNDNSTKNNMLVNNNIVIKYDKKREEKNLNGVDVGYFILNKKTLDLLPNSNSEFEKIVIPHLIKQKKLAAYYTDQKYYSIGDIKRVKNTAKFLKQKKVIFLDRDGTINVKAPKAEYIKEWVEFKFLPGVIDAIKKLSDHGYKIYIISNQPGIARGMVSEKKLKIIHQNMKKELKKNGAKINGIYYCPHGWDEGCNCRKPKPGMLIQASRDHLIDLTKTIFIGDDERDVIAGEAAGCKTFLVNKRRSLLNIVNSLVA